eukprot:CAMPEP_0117689460 /NCGR_PEP_ID=MMETSP0804-20121206/24510_1 /TAXON_ID=1074897 /ORGANISM="Tetraselmis astigmatica, Strain CCMP880" /LENGTH=226 /DNA_ID=CAMNT_0005502251 /DNA_START=76 /DNA_END=756 /DNA_ORIENTATION=+
MDTLTLRGSSSSGFACGASGAAEGRPRAPRSARLSGPCVGAPIVCIKESLIGKRPVPVPSSVKVKVEGQSLSVKGPKGELDAVFAPEIDISLEEGTIKVTKRAENLRSRQLHGLTRSLINNMVVGVSDGFTKTMILNGVGYRAQADKKNLTMSLGLSHPVVMEIPAGIEVTAEDKGVKLIVSSYDKVALGDFCAKVRAWRPPEPYKGKGIRFEGEFIRRKEGKSGK